MSINNNLLEDDFELDGLAVLDNFIESKAKVKIEPIEIVNEDINISSNTLMANYVNYNGKIMITVVDNKTGMSEIIDLSDDVIKILNDSNLATSQFNKSKSPTNVKCNNCGNILQKRTVDFINRHSHKVKGTKFENKYYCYTCQKRVFNNQLYV